MSTPWSWRPVIWMSSFLLPGLTEEISTMYPTSGLSSTWQTSDALPLPHIEPSAVAASITVPSVPIALTTRRTFVSAVLEAEPVANTLSVVRFFTKTTIHLFHSPEITGLSTEPFLPVAWSHVPLSPVVGLRSVQRLDFCASCCPLERIFLSSPRTYLIQG